ncbi:hypothetical protein F2Q70_00005672 [Brassica cretica]|uniref:Uncharacterized protein n=1 Tax=Brassica cretica TaxID=69181 RepID=A0A8S9J038_BRACR|nr:hypothetical protein F2Q70_00005672 [Brassica cretica]
MDLKAQAEPLGGGSFHGVSWRDRDRESNDLVNHIGGVFRYFIVDVVDPGSTPDVARCGRELEHMLIDSEGPRLEETRHMKKLPSETEESQGSVEAGCHVSRRKTVGRSSLQLHKFTEERFTRLRVTHKIRWWQAASIRKKGFRAVLDLQSQGFCMGLSEDSVRDFTVFLGYLYMMVFFSQCEWCCGRVEGDRLVQICLCVIMRVYNCFLLEWICENEELLVQGRVRLNRWRCQIEIDSGWKHFKSGSWVHERNGFWLVEESQRSHQVSVTETWCTSTKRKLEQRKRNQRERRFKVRLSLKILVKDKEKYAGGIGLNRLLRLVVILRKKGMRQQSSTLVQEAKVATTASRNMCELYLRGIVKDV